MKKHHIHTLLIWLFVFLCFHPYAQAGLRKPYSALLIGISNYTGNWKPLKVGPEIDSIELAIMKRGFPKSSIVKILDADATKANVLNTLNRMLQNAELNDVIYLHFSGHGVQLHDKNGDESDKLDEALVMFDYPKGPVEDSYTATLGFITDDELNDYILQLSKKVGVNGQVVVSIDASHSGPDEVIFDSKDENKMITRGGFMEFDSKTDNQGNIAFYATCLSYQMAYEYEGMGMWAYSFIHALADTNNRTHLEIFKAIKATYLKIGVKSTPVLSGITGRKIFEPSDIKYVPKAYSIKKDLKDTTVNFFVITIGIDTYQLPNLPNVAFNNCSKDAKRFSTTILNQFNTYHKGKNNKIVIHELINEGASMTKILAAINNIMNSAKKEDYFFFNFAGFTANGFDSAGKEEIYFMPFSEQDIITIPLSLQLASIPKACLSLRQLRDLLIFIKCQNQLIISEAGLSETFTTLFTKSMIETSPSIMDIEKRNRVIMVPRSSGLDGTFCNSEQHAAGPIAYFASEIGKSHYLLGLFSESKSSRQRIAYEFTKMEISCNFTSAYTEIFFERDILDNLQFYLKDVGPTMRGGKSSQILRDTTTTKSFQKKYALCIGTSNYPKGMPNWTKLPNAIEDADSVGSLLKSLYGYEVLVLKDPSANEIISALEKIAQKVKKSDQFICFIAGHGDHDPNFFDDGFLVLSESLSKGKDPYLRTYLPFTTIGNILDNFNCNQVMLLVDVCFGGAFDQKLKHSVTRSDLKIDGYGDMDMKDMIEIKRNKRTRIIISSGTLNVVPDGYGGNHSPFAARIISALESDGGESGALTSSSLYEMVKFLPSKPFKGDFISNEFGSEFFVISNRVERSAKK